MVLVDLEKVIDTPRGTEANKGLGTGSKPEQFLKDCCWKGKEVWVLENKGSVEEIVGGPENQSWLIKSHLAIIWRRLMSLFVWSDEGFKAGVWLHRRKGMRRRSSFYKGGLAC